MIATAGGMKVVGATGEIILTDTDRIAVGIRVGAGDRTMMRTGIVNRTKTVTGTGSRTAAATGTGRAMTIRTGTIVPTERLRRSDRTAILSRRG
ncbi:hypothetical protein [Rhizobium tubonense]|uniref:hypothetical protein n=1 Tax=Rhizobium tubonense TaxID=484088 RepID=UPI003B834B2B